MDKRTVNRREFLKLLGASAAAAGLSHFQFLNLGVRTAFAKDDTCTAQTPDVCAPQVGNPDVCFEPSGGDGDVCGSLDPGGVDICGAGSPDECIQGVSADICAEGPGEMPPDICQPSGQPPDPDVCEPLQTGPAPDTCGKASDDVDVCPDGPDGDGDLCNPNGAGFKDPDTCEPAIGESDTCDPTDRPPDNTTAVRLASFGARPAEGAATAGLPMLGGVAAGAAVAWVLRRRIKHSQDEKDAG